MYSELWPGPRELITPDQMKKTGNIPFKESGAENQPGYCVRKYTLLCKQVRYIRGITLEIENEREMFFRKLIR